MNNRQGSGKYTEERKIRMMVIRAQFYSDIDLDKGWAKYLTRGPQCFLKFDRGPGPFFKMTLIRLRIK